MSKRKLKQKGAPPKGQGKKLRIDKDEFYRLSAFKCDKCKRGFANMTILKVHSKKEHNRRAKYPVRVGKYVSDIPELLSLWNDAENRKLGLDPTTTMLNSGKDAHWHCTILTCIHPHNFVFQIRKMSDLPICILCRGTRSCECESFYGQHPVLVDTQWDYKANDAKGLDPRKLKPSSNKRCAFWCKEITCDKGCEHKWETSINNRVYHGTGCPYCSRQKVCPCNSIKGTSPDIMKNWDKKETMKPGSTYLNCPVVVVYEFT